MFKDSIIAIVILTFGIGLMAYSFFLAIKLIGMIEKKELKNKCKLILWLICFFLIGYMTHYYCLIMGHAFIYFTEIMTSLIFCLGAVFVIIVLTINIKLIKGLHEANKELYITNNKLKKTNSELRKAATQMRANNAQVTKAKKEAENKNTILKATLEQLYKFKKGKDKDEKYLKKDIEKTNKKINKLKGYLTR